MVVTVGLTKKGGVGKSTVVTNLAVDLARSGKFVKILDADPENTASMDFINDRKRGDINCTVLNEVQDLLTGLEDYKEDIVIIDIGGMESDLTAAAIAVADILFIPFRLSSKDLKALGRFLEWTENLFNDEAFAPGIYIVPNFVHPLSSKSSIERELAPLTSQGYKIGTIMTNRTSYIDSADEGLSVTEFGDAKAAAEIYNLKQIVLENK